MLVTSSARVGAPSVADHLDTSDHVCSQVLHPVICLEVNLIASFKYNKHCVVVGLIQVFTVEKIE